MGNLTGIQAPSKCSVCSLECVQYAAQSTVEEKDEEAYERQCITKYQERCFTRNGNQIEYRCTHGKWYTAEKKPKANVYFANIFENIFKILYNAKSTTKLYLR